MTSKIDSLAKKYAQSTLNVYFNSMDEKCFQSCIRLQDFFIKNKKLQAYLNIPTIKEDVKQDVIGKILVSLDICKTIGLLINVLLRHRRLELFPYIIKHIIRLYRAKKNILTFMVKTSQVLTTDEENEIIHFLEAETKASIVATFEVEKDLICGLRIQGDTLMLEHSIAKQVRNIRRSIVRRIRL